MDPKELDRAIKTFGPLPEDWPNEKTRNGSLLSMAGRKHQYEWIKYLINHGAKVDITTFFRNFPEEEFNDENSTKRFNGEIQRPDSMTRFNDEHSAMRIQP